MKNSIIFANLITLILVVSSIARADMNDVDGEHGMTLLRRLNKLVAVSYIAGLKKTETKMIKEQFPEIVTNSEKTFTTIALLNDSESCYVYIDVDTLNVNSGSECVVRKK